MDHRCLYGHRVSSEFSWAIKNSCCPACGARTVSVTGYQLARGLAQDVSLDARMAFDAVRYLESRYELKERDVAEPVAEEPESRAVAPAVTSVPYATDAEPEVTELGRAVAVVEDPDAESTAPQQSPNKALFA